jgi:hypothetical protein
MSALLNRLASMLSRWVYPANQPSAFPFVVRRVVANGLIRALLAVYRCQIALGRWGWR